MKSKPTDDGLTPTEEDNKLRSLYPEIAAAGRLSLAIENILVSSGHPIAADRHDPPSSVFWATFQKDRRSITISAAAGERRFMLECWSRGVPLGSVHVLNLQEAARIVTRWLVDQSSLRHMEEHIAGFSPRKNAYEFESCRGVEARWHELLLSTRSEDTLKTLFAPLIVAAAGQAGLRQLFPYHSMNSLRFSRTTGYPYTTDCPWAEVSVKEGLHEIAKQPRYRAIRPDGKILGEGSPEEVIRLVVKALPANIGPAVDGTAEDLPNGVSAQKQMIRP